MDGDRLRSRLAGLHQPSGVFGQRGQAVERQAGRAHPAYGSEYRLPKETMSSCSGKARPRPNPGNPITTAIVGVMLVADGKVREGTAYIDTALVADLWQS